MGLKGRGSIRCSWYCSAGAASAATGTHHLTNGEDTVRLECIESDLSPLAVSEDALPVGWVDSSVVQCLQ